MGHSLCHHVRFPKQYTLHRPFVYSAILYGTDVIRKTQIAISIRSLFISPKIPIFNLNIGTDAAMSTLMSTFRDVPVVLDEYNNKDISDIKFQALKGIVYDGDGRQKRKGTSGKEIENDKVYAPVIIAARKLPNVMTMHSCHVL